MDTIDTNCCKLTFKKYKYKLCFSKEKPKKKGGIILLDLSQHKILLIQSRGDKWGVPKGSIEATDRNIKDCAIREMFEETGLMIPSYLLEDPYIQIKNRTYFLILHNLCSAIADSDATGIGWLCLNCARELFNDKKIDLTKDCLCILKKLIHENKII